MTSVVLGVKVERAINHLPDCSISAFALVASRNGLCIFKVHLWHSNNLFFHNWIISSRMRMEYPQFHQEQIYVGSFWLILVPKIKVYLKHVSVDPLDMHILHWVDLFHIDCTKAVVHTPSKFQYSFLTIA